MKPHYQSVLALGVFALIAAGCPNQSSGQVSAPDTSAGQHFAEAVVLPRQTLTFKPTRNDITVGCVIISLYQADMGKALKLDAIRVNGVRPKSERLYLKQVGKNQFELPALRIEYSSKELGGPLYMSLKAWFNELTNQEDSPYYESENVPDRYALLSYCTNENDDPSKVNARLGANRARTLKEFNERLARPFVIRLNQRPLREGLGRWPMVNNQGRELSDADLKIIEQLVRDRGERYVIAISANRRNRAIVDVGDHNVFEGKRRYDFVRSNGEWRIEKVEQSESGW